MVNLTSLAVQTVVTGILNWRDVQVRSKGIFKLRLMLKTLTRPDG